MEAVAEEERKEFAIDVDLEEETKEDSNIEWEVETVTPEEPESEQVYDRYQGGYYNDRGAQVARACNKHIFTWVYSYLLGVFGIDRFMRGQIGLGIFKACTFGGFGIWYLVDLVLAIVKSYLGEYRDMDDLTFDYYGRYIY
jgi:TM2 domain-containing membrane protein YozV